MKNITFILLFVCCSLFSTAQSQTSLVKELPLIPYPSQVEKGVGNFKFDAKTSIVLTDKARFDNEALYLQSLINSITGKSLSINKKGSKNVIEISYNPQITNKESYNLTVMPEKIVISASDGHGAFNAMQTIRQLLPIGKTQSELSLPAVKIQDTPAFTWRGMHLDISRHFFNMDYIKRHIDRLAFYKFNKFHIHLTDDQGWRLEIKKYPKLTEVGAWRTFNKHDSICMERAKEDPNFIIDTRFIHEKDGQKIYGGFYTQKEMKEIINYAQARHIEIIPEVDMPGHMMAAIKSYPYLVEGQAGWGQIFSTPLAVYKDEVYTFTKDVLAEIIDLFPSKYIHIGADEVDKTFWEKSDLCKKFMEEKGIENVNKLQSYFVHEMQDFVESKGKRIIAWDEILQGGTNPDVTVMYWRGWVKDAPMKAIENGNEVIMTPTNPLYFDYANNSTSINSVYYMDVIPNGIAPEKAYLVQGAQANLWAEKIPTEQQADFQMYPRMLALAERVWTNNTGRFDDFSERLLAHYPKLDALGVNYRLPDVEGVAQENVYVGKTDFFAKSPLPEMKIHYTTDGSVPTPNSTMLTTPVSIAEPTLLKMALFSPAGVRGEIYSLNFVPTTIKKAVTLTDIKEGLACDFYGNKSYKSTKAFPAEPQEKFVVSNIKAPKEGRAFGMKLKGYIDVPETGIYSFFFTCDDGGVLYIDGETIVDNDGNHSPVLKSGQAALEKGMHPFQLDFVEAGGGYTLKLQYSFNGGAVKDIPDSWFRH